MANPMIARATTRMEPQAYAVGQAVFIRTDTADYAEHAMPFATLDELVRICSQSHPNLILEKILIHALKDGEPRALTLGFIAATKGQRPGSLPRIET